LAAGAFGAGVRGGVLGVAAMTSPGERAPDCSGRPVPGGAPPVAGPERQSGEGPRAAAGTIPG
jgi:hypothetical protein